MTAVPAVANTEQCPCGRPLDPAVFHDDDDQGRQLCEQCCPTCDLGLTVIAQREIERWSDG